MPASRAENYPTIRGDTMALAKIGFHSEALRRQTECLVVLPQKSSYGEIGIEARPAQGAYKTLYLLHGLGDDHTIWLRRTSVERYATEYGICVVMPSADRSFYTDMRHGQKYYEFIARELPARMAEFFPISTKREDTYIAGLSMGGYGALKIALREPERFCMSAGLSPVTDVVNSMARDVLEPIFGDPAVVPDEDDLFKLIEAHRHDAVQPKLYIGTGTEDFLYKDIVRFRDAIQPLGYDFTYRESHGTHCWAFWDEYIQYVLKWMFGA